MKITNERREEIKSISYEIIDLLEAHNITLKEKDLTFAYINQIIETQTKVKYQYIMDA